ncbi:MAG: hypothetical protein ACE5GO_01990 [Anaerolineales bacterium]
MDPVTLVVAALVAGLTAGVTDTSKSAVKDMYESLKVRLKKKAKGKDSAQAALTSVEKNPDSEAWRNVLREELTRLDVEKDTELLNLAKALLEKVDSQGVQSGKYNITVTDAQGVVIGDHARVEQHFGRNA